MEVKTSVDVREVEKLIRNMVSQRTADAVVTRTIAKTLSLASTEMRRAITDNFRVKSSVVRADLRTTTRAQLNRTGQGILFSDSSRFGRAYNAVRFLYGRQSKKAALRVQVRKGATVSISRRAFVGNAGRTVFRRTGRTRLPIEPVRLIGIPQMFNARRVRGRVLDKIEADLKRVALQELRFAVSRGKF